jgi:uncharacterized membrane protein
MTDLLAVAFNDVGGADDVLHKLRRLRHEDLVEVEDACIAERDRNGELHLKQAIGEQLAAALHPLFWHRLIAHILHHGQEPMPSEGRTPEIGLDYGFVRQAVSRLSPGTSALFLVVRKTSTDALIEALKDHPGEIMRTSLPPGERQALAAALGPQPPRIPSAAELLHLARQEKEEEKDKSVRAREAAEAERKRRLDRLRTEPLRPADITALVEHVMDAARRGETKVLAYRFPSEICTDGGRAINNQLPNWPDTLDGQPREIYAYWRSQLKPAGYRLTVKILDYPQGIPGDAGLIFGWDE